MKKIVCLLMVCVMLCSMFCVVSANKDVTVIINGEKVEFTDQLPVIVNGRTMVPFRAAAEKLGCIVEWDAENRVVYLARGKKDSVLRVAFQIDNTEILTAELYNSEEGIQTKEGSAVSDVAPVIINNRTMIPLRMMADCFEAEAVDWDDKTRTVDIKVDTKDYVQATDEDCREFISERFMKAKHILIAFENYEDEKSAEKKANEILALVKKNDDFDSLMNEYSEDPGSAYYPDGYVFTAGEMVKEFEEAVKGLEEGKITDTWVKSTYGYHIIKRESLANSDYALYMESVRLIVLAIQAGLDVA